MQTRARFASIGLAVVAIGGALAVGIRGLPSTSPVTSDEATGEWIAERGPIPDAPAEEPETSRRTDPTTRRSGAAGESTLATTPPRQEAREGSAGLESSWAPRPTPGLTLDAGPDPDALLEREARQAQRRERFRQSAIDKLELDEPAADELMYLLSLLRQRPEGGARSASLEDRAEKQQIYGEITELVGPEKMPILEEMRRRRGGRRRMR
jgi:hypothetical protein